MTDQIRANSIVFANWRRLYPLEYVLFMLRHHLEIIRRSLGKVPLILTSHPKFVVPSEIPGRWHSLNDGLWSWESARQQETLWP